MIKFSAKAYFQGSKPEAASPCISVPAEHISFVKPGWVKLTVDSGEPFFSWARSSPSTMSIVITLRRSLCPGVQRGDVLNVTLESATPHAAKAAELSNTDWLPHVPERYLPVEESNGVLSLWNRYEDPFCLKRRPEDGFSHWWLLGFYQAEGAKSERDFHAANTNPELLGWMRDALGTWGIDRSRMHLGLVHRTGTTQDVVRSIFEPLDLPITFVTAKPKNDPIALLYVNCSGPLSRLITSKLSQVSRDGFPSKEAARAYAIGWLDGDGCITATGAGSWSIGLRLAGYEDEQKLTLKALEHGFGWTFQNGAFGSIRSHTERVLSLVQAAELAVAGGFNASMSRARLVYMLSERIKRYNNRTDGRGRTLTSHTEMMVAERLFDKHLSEEAHVLELHVLAASRFRLNKKAVPYPQEKGRPDHRSRRPWTL